MTTKRDPIKTLNDNVNKLDLNARIEKLLARKSGNKEIQLSRIPGKPNWPVWTLLLGNTSDDEVLCRSNAEYRWDCESVDAVLTLAEASINYEYMFEVGKTYETQAGYLVKVLDRSGIEGIHGALTLVCSDGKYRYDRYHSTSDYGRCTGTNHDYSCPHNLKRPESGRPVPVEDPEKLVYYGTDEHGNHLYGRNIDNPELHTDVNGILFTRNETGQPIYSIQVKSPDRALVEAVL